MLKKIFFEGKIPGFKILQKLILFSSLIPLSILFYPEFYKEFWEIGWFALIVIVFSRPLADVLPKLRILRKIVSIRKEFGIFCWSFILAHWLGFFLLNNYPLPYSFFEPDFWNFTNLFGWWMAWVVVLIPLLLTSNAFSMRFLWKYWKPLQRFTYLFFIFWAVHIWLIKWELGPFALIWLFFLIHFLAYKKIKLWC